MEFFNKYGTTLITILTGIISVFMCLAVFNTTNLGAPIADFAEQSLSQEVNADTARVDYDVADATIAVTNDILEYGQTFDWHDYVQVTIDGVTKPEYKEYVTMVGEVDTSSGQQSHSVTFVLNWNGKTVSRDATFYVRGKLS